VQKASLYWALVTLLVGLVAVAAVYTCFGLDQSDATLETVIRGIEFNDSLLEGIRVTLTEEWTQPEEARQWMRKNWLTKEPTDQGPGVIIALFPPKVVTLRSFITKGEKCWAQRKQTYPEVDFASASHSFEQLAFDGEKITRYSPAANEAYIHLDTAGIGACRPEIIFGIYRTGTCPLAQWLRESRATFAAMESIDDVPCYVLEVIEEQNEKGKTRLWIDASRGFRPRRIQEYWASGEIRKVSEFQEFQKYRDDVWLPHKITVKLYSSKAIRGESFQWNQTTYIVKEIEVNPQIPDNAFTFDFPSDVRIYDARLEEPQTEE